MTKEHKFTLVVGQILIGLGFGLAGAVITSLIAYLVYELRMGLFADIMFALIGGYIGLQVGVALNGFRFLRRNGRQADFLRYFGQSFGGLSSGLLLFLVTIIPMGQSVPHWLTNLLAVALPLTGAIIGFNFRLTTAEKESG